MRLDDLVLSDLSSGVGRELVCEGCPGRGRGAHVDAEFFRQTLTPFRLERSACSAGWVTE